MTIVTQSTVIGDTDNMDNEVIDTENMLEGLFETFMASASIDGQASIKDIFFNGVLSALIIIKDVADDSLENVTSTLDDIEDVLRFKHSEGEIELGHLLDGDGDDEEEEEEGDEDFDDEFDDDSDDEDDDEDDDGDFTVSYDSSDEEEDK